jgi:rubredoxin
VDEPPEFTDTQIKFIHKLHGMPAGDIPDPVGKIWNEEQTHWLLEQGARPAVHVAVDLMNAQTAAAGRPMWWKCANCGSIYPFSQDGSDATVCSERCHQELSDDLKRQASGR